MTGGGIINRKSISFLLLLLTIVLTINIGAIAAATNGQSSVCQTVTSDHSQTHNDKNIFKTLKTVKNSSTTSKSSVSSLHHNAAAGTVKKASAPRLSFSISSVANAASRVKKFIEANHKLPSCVTVSKKMVNMPQFLQLLSNGIIKAKSGSKTPILLSIVSKPKPGVETVKRGSLSTLQYVSVARSVKSFVDKTHRVPSYAKSARGKFLYGTLIYTFSKVMSFYGANKRLPHYVSIVPGITNYKPPAPSYMVYPAIPAELKTYLDATSNCQANSQTIKSLAASITSGKTSVIDKATAIFNWVRDHISYSFYYDTQKGALGTLNARTGNCVDTAHLVVALERAAGNPAKYEHVKAQFSSGTWYGHVFALVYVNGTWYKADGTSYRNKFGVVNNWNTATAHVKGIYKTLPF